MFANIAKFFKPLSQQFRPTGWYAVPYKEVWAFSIAAMIFAPGAVEAALVDRAEIAPELADGVSVSTEGLNQGIDQRMTAQPGEPFRVDGVTESNCGSGQACAPLSPNGGPVGDNHPDEHPTDTNGGGDYSGLYGLLPILIAWSIGLFTPRPTDPWGGLGNPYDRR